MIRIITSVDKALSELLQNRTVDLEKVENVVKDIVTAVKNGGDEQLCAITNRLDGTKLSPGGLAVGQDEIKAAYQRVGEGFLTALRLAAQNIYRFHDRQRRNSWIDPQPDGTTLGQMVSPLGRVGIYVPGGKASYPSSVLMNAIPAAVAGVRQIVMVTPPDKSGAVNPHTLVAAAEAGVTEIYRVGGAQAVAALAYGTESIARVDKIVGPGNIYVTAAKRQVFGVVDIDMLAGPSEVLIVADDSARPDFVAADMLAQAEHDELASSILVTPVAALAQKVQQQLNKQLARLTRRQVAEKSINERGAIVITATLDEAVQVANAFAPEHLELMVADPYRWLGSVHGAGAVFLGHFSPEPVGDYIAGPNHVLPTGGTARFFSPLNVDTFTKKTSIIGYSSRALAKDGEHVVALANTEGLTAHAASVQHRLAFLAESTGGELSGVTGINGGVSDKTASNHMLPGLPGMPSIRPGFGNLPGRVPKQKWNEVSPLDFNRLNSIPGEGEKC
ncbi:histidinol dehydrogenase [Desulfallas thermosapovorans]|uniref:Histidinol dehydrogenase n=1 Tax=Desulfallas thermosapovorans DSM 6562 TaxID=1121431 RepID=A0A5S4ZW26_9FIRM|nr:histidinol dehydrogenase [Desulfallas thermosapovorans DSM 6562]